MLAKPTLEGVHIVLRPLQPIDIDAYFPLLQDAESLRLTGTQVSFTREMALRWLASVAKRDNRIDQAIILRENNGLIGEVVLNEIDTINRSANIRISLMTPYTNRGYGREALQLMMAHAFDQVKLHRLELEVYTFNHRAKHVYELLGFREEGRRRDVLYSDGVYYDAFSMSILEEEYRARNDSPKR